LVVLGLVGCSSDGGSVGAGGSSGAAIAGAPSGGAPVTSFGGSGGAAAGATASGGSTASAGAPVTNGGSLGQGGVPPITNSDPSAHVITWVPPYHINEAKQQLAANFDGTSMADGLSFLALQFWQTNGPAATLQASEANVTWFHDWARQHGVKIILCVDNFTTDWDWPAAVRSFKDNRDAFVQDLVGQVMARDFDGVDLDLEGIVEASADDQQGYTQLAQALASALHPLGKTVTVDSFHGQWNAPNWNWWPDLLPIVDGITTMGYEQSGMDVDYPTLVQHAASAPQKLMIGVPSYKGTWLNHTVSEQLGWIVEQGQIGTAIWDASLTAPEWQQKSVWDQLKSIKAR
jgi:hypothetical protein